MTLEGLGLLFTTHPTLTHTNHHQHSSPSRMHMLGNRRGVLGVSNKETEQKKCRELVLTRLDSAETRQNVHANY